MMWTFCGRMVEELVMMWILRTCGGHFMDYVDVTLMCGERFVDDVDVLWMCGRGFVDVWRRFYA